MTENLPIWKHVIPGLVVAGFIEGVNAAAVRDQRSEVQLATRLVGGPNAQSGWVDLDSPESGASLAGLLHAWGARPRALTASMSAPSGLTEAVTRSEQLRENLIRQTGDQQ
ncbi:MAG: hypothetical protein ACR2PK_08185 [Acidimicrobiales bacterium]